MSDDTTDTQTMADVSHTNPYTGETAGHLFRRGPTVAADGGERRSDGGDPRTGDGESTPTDANPNGTDARTMRDVDHTPPRDATDANGVFERGSEHDDRNADEHDETTVSVDYEADE